MSPSNVTFWCQLEIWPQLVSSTKTRKLMSCSDFKTYKYKEGIRHVKCTANMTSSPNRYVTQGTRRQHNMEYLLEFLCLVFLMWNDRTVIYCWQNVISFCQRWYFIVSPIRKIWRWLSFACSPGCIAVSLFLLCPPLKKKCFTGPTLGASINLGVENLRLWQVVTAAT